MTLEKVAEILANQLNIDASSIKLDSKIVDDLGADSLDVVELLMAMEDEYGVRISDEEAVKLSTVGDIVKIINKKA